MRCPECAGETKLPTFDVPWPVLATAIGAGLALSIAGGVVLGLLSRFFSLGLIESFLVLGMGYLIGEGISVVVNRKRGRSLKYVAAGGVLVSFAILLVAGTGQMNLFDILALAVAVYGRHEPVLTAFARTLAAFGATTGRGLARLRQGLRVRGVCGRDARAPSGSRASALFRCDCPAWRRGSC